MRSKAFPVVMAGLLCALGLPAQRDADGGPPLTVGRGDRGGDLPGEGSPLDPFGNSQGQSQRMPDFLRPVIRSGQVVMEDGTPPLEPVRIERVCGGTPYPEGYTDREGRFSIELGSDRTLAMTDASLSSVDPAGAAGGFTQDPFGGAGTAAGGMGRVNPLGCDLRANLAGYRSDSVSLGRLTAMDRPDVGTIVLRRMANVEGSAISVTTLEAPKKAQKAFDRAFKETRKQKPNLGKAVKELEKAVAEYPSYAAAWNLLGDLRLSLQDVEGAREAYEKSVAADEKYLNPYDPLMRMALRDGRWEEAIELSDRVLGLDPLQAAAHYCRAVASYSLGRVKEAEKSALVVQSGEGVHRFPQVHQLLGTIHAKEGKFTTAAAEFRAFLAVQPESPVAEDLRRQLREWEALGVIESAHAEPRRAPE